jgi:hypothetical protein
MSTRTLTVDLPRPHPAQQRVLSEAARFNAVACGRRWGKTVLGISLASRTALDGFPVGWFAPTYRLLSEAWRELKFLLAEVIRKSNETEKRLELVTGGVIEAWSFDRDENAGRSRKYKRVVVDEAAHSENLQYAWTKAIRPTLTDFLGDAWFLSSPNGKNYFHTLWSRCEPGWARWQLPSNTNPKLDPAEIEDARRDLGDKLYGQEFGAEFLDDTLDVLLPGEWLDRAGKAAWVPAGHTRIATDLGGGNGGDRSVVLARDDNGLRALGWSRGWTLEQTATQVAMRRQQYDVNPNRVSYDQGGIGFDFGNRLAAVGIKGAMGYLGGASGGSKFANLRTAAAWLLRQRLDPETRVAGQQRADFSIRPEWLELMRPELTQLRWTLDNDRKIALEPKEDLMARLGHSPDFADTLCQSFAYPGI